METENARKSVVLKTNAQINEIARSWVIEKFALRRNYRWSYNVASPVFTFYNNQDKYELQLKLYSYNWMGGFSEDDNLYDYFEDEDNNMYKLQLTLEWLCGPTVDQRAYVQLSFIFNNEERTVTDEWLMISPEKKMIAEGSMRWCDVRGGFNESKDLTMKLLMKFDNGDLHEENYSAPISTTCEKSLINDLEGLLTSPRFSDVKLIVADKEFPVHKTILAARSSVFSVMFEHDMLENRKSVVEIDDIEPETMIELLHYIYTGSVKRIESLTGDLLMAADKYDLNDLNLMCTRALIKNLSIASLPEVLKLLDKLEHCHILRDSVLKFVTSHGSEVTNMENLDDIIKSLSPTLLSQVIKALGQSL